MKNILEAVEVRNYKRIRKALLTVEGNTLILSGENESGKSSFLDAIRDVLGGKEQAPAVPIRKGAKEAVVITRLKTKEGRSLKATLTYTPPDHRRIVVTDEDGKPQMSPQALLSAFWAETSFDPSLFLVSEPKEQVAMLKKMAGLDFTALDLERSKLYVERTNINRELDRAKAVAASLASFADVPTSEVSSADVLLEIKEAQAANDAAADAVVFATGKAQAVRAAESLWSERVRAHSLAVSEAKAAQMAHETAELNSAVAREAIPKAPRIDIAPLEAELAALMAKIKAAHAHNKEVDDAVSLVAERQRTADRAAQVAVNTRGAAATAHSAVALALAAVEEAKKDEADARAAADAKPRRTLDPLNAKLAGVETTNRKVRSNAQKASALADVRRRETESEKLTTRIDEIAQSIDESLANAKFPIAGMSFNETGVLVNGLPLDQESDMRKIAIGVEMAAAMNPDKPLMLVKHGNLFTAINFHILEDIAVKRGLTCIIEVAGPTREDSAIHFIEGVGEEPGTVKDELKLDTP